MSRSSAGAFSSHYASETIEAQLAAHAIASRDPSGTTNQDQLISSVFFLRDTRNFWGFLGELESNQSLGIDSRILGGPLVGRRMYQSETAEFTGLAGVVYDEEQPHGAFASQGSAEGMLVGQWRIYKFIYPKVSLDMSVLAFPSISDSPRFRAGANVALTLKVTDRFALSLSEYGNYDSKPPGESTEHLRLRNHRVADVQLRLRHSLANAHACLQRAASPSWEQGCPAQSKARRVSQTKMSPPVGPRMGGRGRAFLRDCDTSRSKCDGQEQQAEHSRHLGR